MSACELNDVVGSHVVGRGKLSPYSETNKHFTYYFKSFLQDLIYVKNL